MSHSCAICDLHSPDTCADETAHDFRSGEVFCVVESIATPIEEVISCSYPSSSPARKRSEASLNSVINRPRATRKTARPCILRDGFYRTMLDDIKMPEICLMATFEGSRMVTLPYILQFFCIAVYPTIPLDSDYVEDRALPQWTNIHLHSTLDWPPTEKCQKCCTRPCDEIHCNQWIIAWSFKTGRPLLGRWLTPGSKHKSRLREHAAHGSHGWQGAHTHSQQSLIQRDVHGDQTKVRTGMVFGKLAVAILEKQCAARRQEWIRLCTADQTHIVKHEREYRRWFEEHEAEIARQRGFSPSEVPSSIRSRPRRPHRGSIMAESLMSQTIYEEDVAMYGKPMAEKPPQKWAAVDSEIKKQKSEFHGSYRRGVRGTSHSIAEERAKRSSINSNAASGKSMTGSYTSTKNNKLLHKLNNRFSILKLQ